MPLILQAIRGLSKGKSAAETYLSLWCHSLSHSIVEMNIKAELIAGAGYNSRNCERIWKERMWKLSELGFIKIAPGKHGDIGCVLILNPHKVLRRHKEAKTPGLEEKLYNSILEESTEYSMQDLRQQSNPPIGFSPNLLPIPAKASA